MTYEQYKRQVIRLAGKKKSHLIPGNDALYHLYEFIERNRHTLKIRMAAKNYA